MKMWILIVRIICNRYQLVKMNESRINAIDNDLKTILLLITLCPVDPICYNSATLYIYYKYVIYLIPLLFIIINILFIFCIEQLVEYYCH